MRALILLLFAATLHGQTLVSPSQLRFGAPGEPGNLKLFAIGLSGMVQVNVGPGLRMELINGVPTLTAVPVPMVRRRVRLAQEANGSYRCTPTAEIYRNGFLQLEGEDYSTDAFGIYPGSPWAASDIVVALYFETGPPAAASTGPPTVARAAQVKNWDQVSVRGLAQEQRSGTLLALDQLHEGRWLLAPAREPAPRCRWTMEVHWGAARLRCW